MGQDKELIKRISRFYDEYHQKRDRKPPPWMKMYWNQFKGDVLEIGAGTLVPDKTTNVSSYLVVEISLIATKILRSKGVQAIVATGEDLPFSRNAFDVVACHDVLEHTPNPDKFIAEMCRVSRGKIVILGPNYSGEESPTQRKNTNLAYRTLDIIRGKHKRVICFKDPYFTYDEAWESDLDAVTGVNLWWVERQMERNGFEIMTSTAFIDEGIITKALGKMPFLKYAGSMMFVVGKKVRISKFKELEDKK